MNQLKLCQEKCGTTYLSMHPLATLIQQQLRHLLSSTSGIAESFGSQEDLSLALKVTEPFSQWVQQPVSW